MTAYSPTETNITIEPIPANPGYYTAEITGRLSDPESDPSGMGETRLAAALNLARALLDDTHPAICLAIAAVLREEMMSDAMMSRHGPHYGSMRLGYERAIRTVEGIA